MNLPDLPWQWIYSRLAWGIVLATPLLCAWPRTKPRVPLAALGLAGAVCAAMWLPQAASPAYWLGLAFQYPSIMLVACCVCTLAARQGFVHHGPMQEPWFARVIAVGGLLLYADSSGWLNAGIYLRGFDPRLAPAAALLMGAWAVWALRGLATRASGLVVMSCAVGYCFTRLPSGNVFDAFLDPLVWFWSLGVTLATSVRRWRRAPLRRPAA
ncbi:MAG: hypothetical protein WA210_23770 [Burkholderiaceae bacterium]